MSKEKKSADSTIVTAIITGIVTIAVTAITVFGSQLLNKPDPTPTPFPTWTNVPTAASTDTPVPTEAVAFGESTSTPAPDTPTPEPSFTPQPAKIGEDWANNCISTLWQVEPASIQTEPKDGCRLQPVGDFNVSSERLNFLVSRRFSGAEVYGMFAPLSAEGTVSLKVDLEILEKGEIWMGVFTEPSIDSQGVIMVIPPGDINKRLLVMKTLPGQTKGPQTQLFNQSSAVYDVEFTYTIGTVRVGAMNKSVGFNAVPVASSQKWLFIGFQTATGSNSIGAAFFDLAFE